ncbi:MAG: 1-acyl-sn-glycerol-3-phosphate acyltransferase, partial [Planctomycetes bacterium]|nr:1-acyl-sn-glycerol-3-phosphate acyltransferase [Planctomycetota bacterium]
MLAWAREIERHIPKSPGWWYGLSQLLLQWTFVPLFRVRLFGRANVPAEGGVLIVCNHQSFLDPMLIGMALPRPVEFLARKSLFKNPFFGWLIRSVHALPIEREGRDVHAIKDAIRRLR